MKRTLSFKKDKEPIVFVPGLFGSMSDVIIPGTGDWHFGVAGIVYKPFIKMLERMGYKEGEDLFVAYYDWRQPIETSASEYLVPVLEHVKNITGQQKVNLVSHSMGGLVCRAYLQSCAYKNDVHQLIQMCTPNAGSSPNFGFWTGGMMPSEENTKVNLVHLYMKVYLWMIEKLHPENPIEAIHTHFPSLGDIVPAREFGDYLFVKNNAGSMQLKPYKKMKTQNKFLDYLNERSYTLTERGIDVTVIAGVGEPTVHYLEVLPEGSSKKWVDGQVVNDVITYAGDGNAIMDSVFTLKGDHHLVHGSHNEVLYKSEAILKSKLEKKKIEGQLDASYPRLEDYMLICWKGKGHVSLEYDKHSTDLYEEQLYEGHGYTLLIGPSIKDVTAIYHSRENEELECRLYRNGVEDHRVERKIFAGEKAKIL